MTDPTPEDKVRDPAADLAVCDAATEPPWTSNVEMEPPDPGIESAGGGTVAHVQCHGNINTVLRAGEEFSHDDAEFIALSRSALPAWLRRAVAAEAEVGRLRAILRDWSQAEDMGGDIGCSLIEEALKKAREAVNQ